ncbi:hypothetical protein O181_013089 [Austropuccinia psidii MF-1]|uniref:Inner centromere protein ARK-binding domain-containing protein n=1 Tax=Austropuccinia psidii MF-1 TaxID=1389203 RepID=A0A9Q3BXI6_9BASI|nr:hypothetical protein [Austropuccinia psidii MF-1]
MIKPSSSSTNTLSSAIPDDIRLKCSYYSQEIKNQVNNLYEDQHKWLEDHLIEIKNTLTKFKDKSSSTRSVMAGIIKTPARKGSKKSSSKTSKLIGLGLQNANDLENPFIIRNNQPLSDLTQSHLNINNPQIQAIIKLQVEEQTKEIQSRLQIDLSKLENRYESPTKKVAQNLNHPSNQSITSSQNLIDPIKSSDSIQNLIMPTLPTCSTTHSSQSESNKQSIHPELLPTTPLLNSTNQLHSYQQLSESRTPPESLANTSTSQDADSNDVFNTAGHELSAIQEGEEEDDQITSQSLPPMPGLWSHQKPIGDQILTSQNLNHPNSHTSKSQKPTTSTIENSCQTATLVENSHQKSCDHPFNLTTSLLPSTSSSAPQTHSITPVIDSDSALRLIPTSTHSSVLPSTTSSQNNQFSSSQSHSHVHFSDIPTSNPSAPVCSTQQPSLAASSTFTVPTQSQPDILSMSHPSQEIAVSSTLSSQSHLSHITNNLSTSIGQDLESLELQPSMYATNSNVEPQLSSSQSHFGHQSSQSYNKTSPSIAPESIISLSKPKPRSDQPTLSTRDAARTQVSERPHFDSIIDVPLNDNPSSIRNNLHTSIGSSSYPNKLAGLETPTPGAPISRNFFTPGNTTAAMIQSPQSQWSTKPSGASSWNQHKPLRTPATMSYNINFTNTKEDKQRASVSAGSLDLFEDLVKPVNLQTISQSSQQAPSSDSQQSIPATRPTSGVDTYDHRPTGLKRTSTDAGFPHSSDLHEAKLIRSHTPGMMNARTSTTGGTTRKGMEDIKNRLSQIQRESAMHERGRYTFNMNGDVLTTSNSQPSVVTHQPTFSKNHITSNLSSVTQTSKTSTSILPANSATGAQVETEKPEELLIDLQSSQHEHTAPLLPSSHIKNQTVPLVTAPILSTASPHQLPVPLEIDEIQNSSTVPKALDSTNLKEPDDSNLSMWDQFSKQKETKAYSPPQTLTQPIKLKSPITSPNIQINKVEPKHLAFLIGAAPTPSTIPIHSPPPSVGELQKPVLEDHTDGVELDESIASDDKCLTQENVQTSLDHHGKDEGDHQSITSSKTSEPIDLNDGAEGDEADQRIEEKGQDVKNPETEAQDDDPYGEPSVEIATDKQELHIDSDQEGYLNEAHDPDSKNNASNYTPLEAPMTPSSSQVGFQPPASNGLMGVFKAGAAFATSWGATKPKAELKSLQLAAVAAKKEQEERDRKAVLKEERRLAAVEKKQAQEKTKLENDKKTRMAEAEKKKQDRDDASKTRITLKAKGTPSHTAIVSKQSSVIMDAAKKRKIESESTKVLDQKKPKGTQKIDPRLMLPSSAHKTSTSSYQPTRVAPVVPTSAIKPTVSKAQQSSTSKPLPVTTQKAHAPSRPPSQISQHSLLPKPSKSSMIGTSQTSQIASSAVKTQQIGSLKGKLREDKNVEEEYIELPDIDSEYSDDDESEHERKEAQLPSWAQSPALREALENQKKVNPDDVFGGTIPPPRMDEIFRGRASRFRNRTSSANWNGVDGLTNLEEIEYAKRMGYHNQSSHKSKLNSKK